MIAPKLGLPALVLLAALSVPHRAAAQEACSIYVVTEGESLADISMRVYGTYNFQNIFNANVEKLASNLNALPGGMELILPCLDGSLPPGADLNAGSALEKDPQA